MNVSTTEPAAPAETRKGKRRPVIAFALAALAVGGIGAAATSAAWTDNVFFSATAEAATFNLQGSLDGGATWQESDNKSSIQLVVPATALANLLPGQTRTINLDVRNQGSVSAALTWKVEFADGSTFTTNPTATVTGLTTTLTPATGLTAADQFQLVVTTPAGWTAENQGKTATIIITIEGTATA